MLFQKKTASGANSDRPHAAPVHALDRDIICKRCYNVKMLFFFRVPAHNFFFGKNLKAKTSSFFHFIYFFIIWFSRNIIALQHLLYIFFFKQVVNQYYMALGAFPDLFWNAILILEQHLFFLLQHSSIFFFLALLSFGRPKIFVILWPPILLMRPGCATDASPRLSQRTQTAEPTHAPTHAHYDIKTAANIVYQDYSAHPTSTWQPL